MSFLITVCSVIRWASFLFRRVICFCLFYAIFKKNFEIFAKQLKLCFEMAYYSSSSNSIRGKESWVERRSNEINSFSFWNLFRHFFFSISSRMFWCLICKVSLSRCNKKKIETFSLPRHFTMYQIFKAPSFFKNCKHSRDFGFVPFFYSGFFVSKKSVSEIKITLAPIGKLSKEKEDPKGPLSLLNEEVFHEKTEIAIARAEESNCPQNPKPIL